MTDREETSIGWPPKITALVGAVVLRGDRALFVRQVEGHPLEGQWSIPWGYVDPGETPDRAAVRETMEEGGIEAGVQGLLGIQQLHEEGRIAFVFLCHHLGGVPRSDGGQETDDARYFSLAEMNASDEPFEPWCEWIVRRVLAGEYNLVPQEPQNPYHPLSAFF